MPVSVVGSPTGAWRSLHPRCPDDRRLDERRLHSHWINIQAPVHSHARTCSGFQGTAAKHPSSRGRIGKALLPCPVSIQVRSRIAVSVCDPASITPSSNATSICPSDTSTVTAMPAHPGDKDRHELIDSDFARKSHRFPTAGSAPRSGAKVSTGASHSSRVSGSSTDTRLMVCTRHLPLRRTRKEMPAPNSLWSAVS